MSEAGRFQVSVGLAGIALSIFALSTARVFALSSGDIVTAGSVWLEVTLAVALIFVSVMAFSLQVARGYFVRILNKFTLRLGADIWWLAYVLIRDALLFMSFIIGLLVFLPGTFLDYPMAVPFMPLSVVLFGLALLTKLYFDADDNRNAFRGVTVFIFLATVLWIFGAVFITETPLALTTLPPGVSASSGPWYWLYDTFSSTQNLPLAMISFQACFPALGILGLLAFAHPILHSRLPKIQKAVRVASPLSPTVIPGARTSTLDEHSQDPPTALPSKGSRPVNL